MEADPINACYLAIDDNVFLLNYNKAVVVRNGVAYTNTRTRVRRLVRYSSSEDLQDEVLGASVDELLKPSQRLLDDKSESFVDNKGFRLHWLCTLHCKDIFIPSRVSGLHFPCSKMGQMLQLQYLIDCKPDDLYTESFTKALEYSIMRILTQKVQFKEFTVIPGYSIQLNWLIPRTKKVILTNIERILCFQKDLRMVSFEYQRLDTLEAIKLLLSLAQSSGTTLKELFLWYFFKENSCPFVGYHSSDKETPLILLDSLNRDDKVYSVSKNRTTFCFQIDDDIKKDSKNSLISTRSNKSIIKKKNSEESIKERKESIGTKRSILLVTDDAPLSTWIENWIMDICNRVIDEKIEDNDVNSSAVRCCSSVSESRSILTNSCHSSQQMCPDESHRVETLSVSENICGSIRSRDSGSLIKGRKLRLDKSSVTLEQLSQGFHSTSEKELLTEVRRRVTQPVEGRSKKIKLAKLRSIDLCMCYEKDFGLDEICSLCQRNAKEDLTYSIFDKLELEREIHQLLYFPPNSERIYFLDDEKKCFQNCHNYVTGHSVKNTKGQKIRMVYRIALSAFTCLTRLSINYNYLADGSGETIFGIGAIRRGKLMDLEILCSKYDIPSNSKHPHTYYTRRLSIPNLVWKKIKCLCPQLRVHLVMFEISKYDSANSFWSKDMPLTSLHISTGNNVTPVNLLKPGEKLDLWNFDQILKFMGMFHLTLVTLTLELWLLPYRIDDTLVKLLTKLKLLERFRYRGPIQSLRTIDRICDLYLTNDYIIELKIWKIQEPLLKSEADLEAIKCKEKKYKPEFVNRDVDFALGSFPY
ncbi:hypothetical protein LSTR_LSTR002739 [Laodelphax striatellus]|uniref:Uncharacterized protein n=1 Tax=Laodelphax striatellus TaxID=195883 RepID=A0A482X5S4_LAOST|nr:hypothetical protein LSTR_LSTR002739 [Laodelphax striatellus]